MGNLFTTGRNSALSLIIWDSFAGRSSYDANILAIQTEINGYSPPFTTKWNKQLFALTVSKPSFKSQWRESLCQPRIDRSSILEKSIALAISFLVFLSLAHDSVGEDSFLTAVCLRRVWRLFPRYDSPKDPAFALSAPIRRKCNRCLSNNPNEPQSAISHRSAVLLPMFVPITRGADTSARSLTRNWYPCNHLYPFLFSVAALIHFPRFLPYFTSWCFTAWLARQ
jgi:hypothetical protein